MFYPVYSNAIPSVFQISRFETSDNARRAARRAARRTMMLLYLSNTESRTEYIIGRVPRSMHAKAEKQAQIEPATLGERERERADGRTDWRVTILIV